MNRLWEILPQTGWRIDKRVMEMTRIEGSPGLSEGPAIHRDSPSEMLNTGLNLAAFGLPPSTLFAGFLLHTLAMLKVLLVVQAFAVGFPGRFAVVCIVESDDLKGARDIEFAEETIFSPTLLPVPPSLLVQYAP